MVHSAGEIRRGLSMPHGLGWGILGSVCYGLSQWALVVLLARVGSAVMVGQYSLALALTAPLQMFSNMQLANLLATDAGPQHPFRLYLRTRRLTVLATVVAIGGMAALRPQDRTVLLLVGASRSFEALSDIRYGLFINHHRLDLVARSQTLRALAGVLGFWAMLRSGMGLVGALMGLTTVWCLVLILHDRPCERSLTAGGTMSPGRGQGVPALIRQAFPLGVVAALISLNASLPRLALDSHRGLIDLGVFATIASLVVAGRLMLIPLAQAVMPRLASSITRGDVPTFRTALRFGLLGAGALGVGGILVASLAGATVLRLFFGAEFAGEPGAFLVLMISAAFGYWSTILQGAATAARILRPQVLALVSSVVVTGVLALAYVPARGVLGAAQAVLGGALAELVGSGILLWWGTRHLWGGQEAVGAPPGSTS